MSEELIKTLTEPSYANRAFTVGELSGYYPSIAGFDRKLASSGNTCRHLLRLGCKCRSVRAMREGLQQLIKQAVLRQGDRILELGSANGLMTVLFASVGMNAYGIDINESLCRLADKKLEDLRSKGLLPQNVECKFANGSYYLEDLVDEQQKSKLKEGLQKHERAVIFPFQQGNPYQQLGINFGDFDVFYGFLWDEDERNVWKLFAEHAKPGAKLLHAKVGKVNGLDLFDLGLTSKYVEIPAYSKTNLYLIEKMRLVNG